MNDDADDSGNEKDDENVCYDLRRGLARLSGFVHRRFPQNESSLSLKRTPDTELTSHSRSVSDSPLTLSVTVTVK